MENNKLNVVEQLRLVTDAIEKMTFEEFVKSTKPYIELQNRNKELENTIKDCGVFVRSVADINTNGFANMLDARKLLDRRGNIL
jgi:hypothetical protein